MPKVSWDSASKVEEMGPSQGRTEDLDGYTVSIVRVGADVDLTPLLQGLPNDQCHCSHWGYVTKGRMWFRAGDREESFAAGDAFYVSPGHTSGADEGAEFIIFSPAADMAVVEAHMAQRGLELHSA